MAGGPGAADAEALRTNMVELQHVAAQVGSRRPIGITAYKPPNSHSGDDPTRARAAHECSISGDGVEQALFSFVGMLGLPLLPAAYFPDLTFTGYALNETVPAAAMFSMHALKVRSGQRDHIRSHLYLTWHSATVRSS